MFLNTLRCVYSAKTHLVGVCRVSTVNIAVNLKTLRLTGSLFSATIVAYKEQMMFEFCTEVGLLALDYGVDDGSSLCYNLIEMGVIDMEQGVETAARIVAQYVLQA